MKLHPTDEDLSVGTPDCAMDGAQGFGTTRSGRGLSEIQQGPRETVGLVALWGGELDTGDVDFKAAVFGVRIFADAVGDVDEGAFC
jgi:hypothetical protein